MASANLPVDTHPQLSLPTLSQLKSTVPSNVSPTSIAAQWLQSFTSAIGYNDTKMLGELSYKMRSGKISMRSVGTTDASKVSLVFTLSSKHVLQGMASSYHRWLRTHIDLLRF